MPTDPKPAKDTRTPAQKFSEMGSSRLTKAVDAIGLLENLSNPANYSYTPEQVTKITGHLTAAVKRVQDAFAAGGVKKADKIAI